MSSSVANNRPKSLEHEAQLGGGRLRAGSSSRATTCGRTHHLRRRPRERFRRSCGSRGASADNAHPLQRPRRSFRALFDAEEHPAIHCKPNRLDEARPVGQPGEDVVRAIATESTNEPRTIAVEGFDPKEPGRFGPRFFRRKCLGIPWCKNGEELAGYERDDLKRRHFRMEAKRVAFPDGPICMDGLGVPQVAPGEVLEPLVAVESSSIGTDLRHPWPHVFSSGFDLDPVGPGPTRSHDEIVARIAR